ncbi:OmpA family protein [Flavobacterium sp. NST-5]|uniref:OmpA family protein n=1 Tax=Flavobacterium ichthyis TaxID=2698827 RepID=A0ABW9Z9J8_9FLAO|nr:OmpA family protein [Flavobacterium ichthyis]NBL65242.1 OmpA family protein [Flavobacterium ichthyis]
MKFSLIAFIFCLSTFAQERHYVIYFDTDIFEKTNSGNNLNQFSTENPKAIVTKIYGFCDQSASDSYNDTLSLKRAKFVENFLKKQNVNFAENLEIKGFGERFASAENQQSQRKVVVFFELKPEKQVLPNKLSHNINQLKVGEKLALPNLYFYNMSGQTVPSSEKTLTDLLETLVLNQKLKIEIQGHVCCVEGKDIYDIANLRARSIYNYLISKGINSERLRYKSFSNTQPVFPIPEKNEEERNANRRVEIMILANE